MSVSYKRQLTPNFNLSEFIVTSYPFSNLPIESQIRNIEFVAYKLQYIRDHIQLPIYIDSGFRTAQVNAACGGSPSSLHLSGLAVDIRVDNIGYKLMPKFLKFVLDTSPYEIHFNSSRIMHISWHPNSVQINSESFNF